MNLIKNCKRNIWMVPYNQDMMNHFLEIAMLGNIITFPATPSTIMVSLVHSVSHKNCMGKCWKFGFEVGFKMVIFN